jgi:Kef-type K+ transport system membrane component KefB
VTAHAVGSGARIGPQLRSEFATEAPIGHLPAVTVSDEFGHPVLGVVVANRARHHIRPFRSIEGISEPFLALFFFVAGYKLEWEALPALGLVGLAYVAARITGRVVGGQLGGRLAHSTPEVQHRLGLCLMPQAGIALGLALVASDRLPDVDFLLPLVIAATVVFELIGPPLTLLQLRKAGETGYADKKKPG